MKIFKRSSKNFIKNLSKNFENIFAIYLYTGRKKLEIIWDLFKIFMKIFKDFTIFRDIKKLKAILLSFYDLRWENLSQKMPVSKNMFYCNRKK